MARWITQTYNVNDSAEIEISALGVWIGNPDAKDHFHCSCAQFIPKDAADAAGMAIALRAAAKRLEEIAKEIR